MTLCFGFPRPPFVQTKVALDPTHVNSTNKPSFTPDSRSATLFPLRSPRRQKPAQDRKWKGTSKQPVACSYNVLEYASETNEAYTRRFGGGRPLGRAFVVGMNPGPWGMVRVVVVALALACLVVPSTATARREYWEKGAGSRARGGYDLYRDGRTRNVRVCLLLFGCSTVIGHGANSRLVWNDGGDRHARNGMRVQLLRQHSSSIDPRFQNRLGSSSVNYPRLHHYRRVSGRMLPSPPCRPIAEHV